MGSKVSSSSMLVCDMLAAFWGTVVVETKGRRVVCACEKFGSKFREPRALGEPVTLITCTMHVGNVRDQLFLMTKDGTTPQEDAKEMLTPPNFISDLRHTWGSKVRVIGVLAAECLPFRSVWPGCSLWQGKGLYTSGQGASLPRCLSLSIL